MLETGMKIGTYVVPGLVLVMLNVWFVKFAYQGIFGGDVAIEPFQVYEADGTKKDSSESMVRMLISNMSAIQSELSKSQDELQEVNIGRNEIISDTNSKSVLTSIGIVGDFPFPKLATLNAKLFTPVDLDVKISGVDVGSILPWVQRFFVQDRILKFSMIKVDDKNSVIAADLSALGGEDATQFSLDIPSATPNEVAKSLANALLKRSWAADDPVYAVLEEDEFNSLIKVITAVAKTNRRVLHTGTPLPAEYQSELKSIFPLVEEFSKWHELAFFAATIAESAEDLGVAKKFFKYALDAVKDEEVKKKISGKIEDVKRKIDTEKSIDKEESKKKIEEHVAFATQQYDIVFAKSISAPEVKMIDSLNAYWDGKAIYANPVVSEIPDFAYHEAAYPFISSVVALEYTGESAALLQSYGDVLSAFVKQKKLGQTAKDADWVLGEGWISWFSGRVADVAGDRRPLRSLKAPGTAYDDQRFGKDTQVADYSKKVADADPGSPYVNSGIPNKAFYEFAVKVGTDAALAVWLEALAKFTPTTTLPEAAKLIVEAAVAKYGGSSEEVKFLRDAWTSVNMAM